MVHEAPEAESEDINLTHSTGPEADEDGQTEGEADEDDDESGSDKGAPIIQIPVLASSKKRSA